jgi:hypothetical protein
VSPNEIYATWQDQVNFLCVYIQEAHSKDGRQVPHNLRDDVIFYQPGLMQESDEIARACMLDLGLAMPTLLDDMEN